MNIFSQKKIVMMPLLFIFFGVTSLSAEMLPKIETKKWEGGSSVSIVFPEKYSGSVETTCVNNVCTSTTTTFTEKDKKEMVKKIEKQRQEIEVFWKKQQELFDALWKKSFSVWSI